MVSQLDAMCFVMLSERAVRYQGLQTPSFVMPTARERGYRTRYKHIHVRSARAIHGPRRSGTPFPGLPAGPASSLSSSFFPQNQCPLAGPANVEHGRSVLNRTHGRPMNSNAAGAKAGEKPFGIVTARRRSRTSFPAPSAGPAAFRDGSSDHESISQRSMDSTAAGDRAGRGLPGPCEAWMPSPSVHGCTCSVSREPPPGAGADIETTTSRHVSRELPPALAPVSKDHTPK